VCWLKRKLIPSPQQRANLRISPAIEAHFEGWVGINNAPDRYFPTSSPLRCRLSRCGGIPTRRFRHGDTYVAEHQALLTPLQDFLQKCRQLLVSSWSGETQYEPTGVEIDLRVGVNPYNPHTITWQQMERDRVSVIGLVLPWLAILAIMHCRLC